jgi:hypothetical protein
VLWLLLALLVLVGTSLFTPLVQDTLRATSESGDVFLTTGVTTAEESTLAPAEEPAAVTVDPCGNGMVRCFDPVLYAIDTVVPLVALDQRSTWYPNVHAPYGRAVEWWLNLSTIFGWLLSSIFLLSFTRLARTA